MRDLHVHFPTEDGLVKSVDGLSFDLARGQTLGIVGESGSGKSVTSQAILGLHKGTQAEVSGEIWLDGKDLVRASEGDMRALRGNEMAMIFQDPLSSLHPFYTIGGQIVEAYRRAQPRGQESRAPGAPSRCSERVGIPNPDKRFDDYPHQFSGGMRQRAMIAMALVCDPKLLIADEPTTALDVTVQAQILELMKDLQREFNSAIILITHDLGVVAETCETRRRHVRRAVRRAGLGARHLLPPARCPTPGACSARCRAWTAPGSAARPDPGHAAVADQGAAGLRLPPALPLPRPRRRGARATTVRPELVDIDSTDHRARCHIDTASAQPDLLQTEIAPPSS